jgi:2Fe-2S ferredoxin
MPKLTVLPHPVLCAAGAAFDAAAGETLCDLLLAHGIGIEHACEKSCACTTCHVVVRSGYGLLAPAEEKEEDMLDKAWGLEATSRLSCQARMPQADLVIEIPKYTINYEREGGGNK